MSALSVSTALQQGIGQDSFQPKFSKDQLPFEIIFQANVVENIMFHSSSKLFIRGLVGCVDVIGWCQTKRESSQGQFLERIYEMNISIFCA